jgi:outer membrane receptor protein involved in Fe transport
MFRLDRRSTFLALIVACAFGTARADNEPAPPAEDPPADPKDGEDKPPDKPADPPAQPTGTVKGTILDASAKTGLPAVTIQIKGPAGEQTIATELDGTYTLSLAAGTYTITFSTPEFVSQTKTVTVTANGTLTLSLTLSPAAQTGKAETVEIYDTIDTRKASAVLAARRSAATVSDAIATEQIQRSADNNASDAVRRIVSATIQDNRYVVIRGLGGRYSTTLLNGVQLPSPDPDVPSVPLDLFPAALLTNLTVHKTFSPDMPGNFAGGALGIETRSYPSKFMFKAKVGVAGDSTSSLRSSNAQSAGSFDALGYDDGGRALPAAIPSTKLAGDPAVVDQQIGAFPNTWGVSHRTASPNLSLGATLGNTTKIDGRPLGYVASVQYGHGYRNRLTHIARPGGDDGMGGTLPSLLQLDDQQGIEQVSLGAVGGVGYTPKRGHRLDLFTLYSHSVDITSSEVTGTDNTSTVIDRTRLQFTARELLFTQLVGEDRLGDRAVLEWQGNVAKVAQREPDTRDLLRTETGDGRMAISSGIGGAQRMYGDLDDTTLGATAAVKVPFEKIKLKAGTAIQRSTRTYQARRFQFLLSGDSVFLPPDQAFGPASAGSMSMFESTLPSDGYNATRTVGATYAMADIDVTKKLRLIGGARLEVSRLDVGLDSKIDLMSPASPHTIHNDTDVLPAINSVYALGESTNLRAAYATTVARPNFREIAPALYFDYVRRRTIGGNPNLAETKIQNVDLRWERFLGDTEIVAASAFGKYFKRPIEKTIENAGDGDNVGFANSPNAKSYGVELEARVSLGRIAKQLAPFTIGSNLSLIGSQIEIPGGDARPLQGQSAYVANLGLGYRHIKAGTTVDLLFNTFGRRIEEVGSGGAGNVYEEPFNRLDLVFSQQLHQKLKLKLAGSNLLDQRVRRTQDGVDIFSYKAGVLVLGTLELAVE